MTLDFAAIRAEFPILDQQIHGYPLVYLDNAATTQKPRAVIDAISAYYEHDNANVHRGVHLLSQRATDAFEAARREVQGFLGARDTREVIFVRGATEGLNLVAQAWGRQNLRPGDEILLTTMEHHSNIVPWQLVAQATGAVVRPIPITDEGALDLDAFAGLLSAKTKVVGAVHVSNALGTVNPVAQLAAMAREVGAISVIDGAQALPHGPVDVAALGCDFYAFSGHKVYGPTGIGGLYGRLSLLEAMPPWQGGGEMIRSVTFGRTIYAPPPAKFEAGTPNIADAIGLGAALAWVAALGPAAIAEREGALLRYGTAKLAEIPGLRMIGTAPGKQAVLSFVLDGIHPHDVGTVLDRRGIAVRTGHHCAQPVMERFGVPATTRASLAVYNTEQDLDRLADGLRETIRVLGR